MNLDKKYKINDGFKIIIKKNNEILCDHKNKIIKFILDDYEVKLLEDYYQNNELIYNNKITNTFKKMIQIKILIPVTKNDLIYEGTIFEKTNIYFQNKFGNSDNLFEKLENATILLIGAGGTGTEIINQLIAVGVKKYVIVDFDVVKYNNFNRQFCYNLNDINLSKIECIKKFIIKKNPEAEVKIYNQKIQNEKDINLIIEKNKNIDIIINAADTPLYQIQSWVVSSSLAKKTPCIFGGVGINSGTIGPLLSTKKAKEKYIKKTENILKNIKSIYPCKGSIGITNSLVSCYMTRDIINFLIGKYKYVKCLNKELVIDLDKDIIYEK